MERKAPSVVNQALNKGEKSNSQNENVNSQTEKNPSLQQFTQIQETCHSLNEELGMLAYAISHDLEQPLRHIMAYAKLLARKIEDQEDPEIQKFAGFIQDAGVTLDGRINAILSYSRLSQHPINKEELDSEKTIRELFGRYQMEAEMRKLDFQTDALPVIHTDPDLFRLIVKKLLENALYFTSQEAQPKIRISATQTEKETTFVIQDNGVGMENNKFDRMVKLFQQGEHSIPKAPNSIGAGLAMVKRAINMLGGTLSYSESPEGETCFHVKLYS